MGKPATKQEVDSFLSGYYDLELLARIKDFIDYNVGKKC